VAGTVVLMFCLMSFAINWRIILID